MNITKYILGSICVFSLAVSSCKVGQKYKAPDLTSMPEQFDTIDVNHGSITNIGWGSLYKDTVLTMLIDKALKYNKDMLIATARIKEMIANKRIQFSGMLPEIGVEAGEQREYLNYGGHDKSNTPKIRGNLNVAWEVDLWGNLRWQNEAGVAAYMQSVEARRALRMAIVAQVAQSYFELKALDRQLSIVRQTVDSRREGVSFARLRYEGGLTSEIPYRQGVVELSRTETLIPNLENQIKRKENDLAILVGDYPSKAIPRGEDIYSMDIPDDLPIEVPSAILRRRPDVRLAEQRLIEKNAKVGAALTDMFPKLQLTGKLGGQSDELSNFIESPAWFISGFLTGPVFNFNKNKAKHNAAKAVYEQEIYSYEKTVLNVFKEVNNAIFTFRKAKEMRESQEKLYNSSRSYLQLARLQYVNGIVNYLDVLDAQRQLFDVEIALNDAVLTELTAVVDLYKALGGGIEK